MLPGDGVLSHACISDVPHHDAGVPRYTQANAPHLRGTNAGPVGWTRDMRRRRVLGRSAWLVPYAVEY